MATSFSCNTFFWGGREGREVPFIRFIRFIGVVKSQHKQYLHCSSYKEKTAPQLRQRVLQDFTFPRLMAFIGHLKPFVFYRSTVKK